MHEKFMKKKIVEKNRKRIMVKIDEKWFWSSFFC